MSWRDAVKMKQHIVFFCADSSQYDIVPAIHYDAEIDALYSKDGMACYDASEQPAFLVDSVEEGMKLLQFLKESRELEVQVNAHQFNMSFVDTLVGGK